MYINMSKIFNQLLLRDESVTILITEDRKRKSVKSPYRQTTPFLQVKEKKLGKVKQNQAFRDNPKRSASSSSAISRETE